MTKDFNNWWDSDLPQTHNPYTEDTPAYWAWAGWVAGVAAEREACAKVCESINADYDSAIVENCAAKIRARGEV